MNVAIPSSSNPVPEIWRLTNILVVCALGIPQNYPQKPHLTCEILIANAPGCDVTSHLCLSTTIRYFVRPVVTILKYSDINVICYMHNFALRVLFFYVVILFIQFCLPNFIVLRFIILKNICLNYCFIFYLPSATVVGKRPALGLAKS